LQTNCVVTKCKGLMQPIPMSVSAHDTKQDQSTSQPKKILLWTQILVDHLYKPHVHIRSMCSTDVSMIHKRMKMTGYYMVFIY